jgi:hypothetical protein
MASFILPDPTPTIPQTLIALRAGLPSKLEGVTREHVIAACRDRGIEIRDGRLQLGDSGSKRGDLYFGIAYAMGFLEPPA